jgi:hypothetical protein
VQRRRAGNCRSDYGVGASGHDSRMRRRKAWARRLEFWNRNDGSGEHRFIERKVERVRRLRGSFGIAVEARDIAERELWQVSIGIERRFGLFPIACSLLFALGLDASFIVRSQDFCATQIFVCVNVLGFPRFFACALLARGFGYILGGAGAALRSTEKQTGANKDCESAAERLAERHPRVHVRLA